MKTITDQDIANGAKIFRKELVRMGQTFDQLVEAFKAEQLSDEPNSLPKLACLRQLSNLTGFEDMICQKYRTSIITNSEISLALYMIHEEL